MKNKTKIIYSIISEYMSGGGIWAFIYTGLVLIKSFIPVIQTILIVSLIDNIKNTSAMYYLGAVIICILYVNIHYKILEYIDIHIMNRLECKIGSEMISTSMNIPYNCFENNEEYNRFARLSESSGIVATAFKRLITLIERIIEIFSLQIFLAMYSIYATIAISIALILCIFLYSKTAKLSWKIDLDTTENEREISYIYQCMTDKNNIAEMQLFNSYIPLIEMYNKKLEDVTQIRLRTMRKNIILQNISSVLLSVFNILIMSGYAILFVNGNITPAVFSGLISSTTQMSMAISTFSINFNNMLQSYLKYKEYYDFIHLELNLNVSNEICCNDYMICAKNIYFKYSDENDFVLKGVNLDVEKNQCVVLVGENGCGKSTLAKIILKLLYPQKGNLYLNEKLINQSSPKSIAVFQDYVKYNLTIREIITNGKDMEDEEIFKVLDEVGLKNDVSFLDYGLDSSLGNVFEKSTNLSEGQWQKLNIARVLACDAELLIFDEPTASLDPIAESLFYEEILKIKGTKTLIIISHRLGVLKAADKVFFMKDGVLKAADKVFFMKDGAVKSEGTHKALMKSDCEYSDMYKAQAKWYQEEDSPQ